MIFPKETEGTLAGVQQCTAPLYFEMGCNAPPNFEDYMNNIPQMGVQNQIPNKLYTPFFRFLMHLLCKHHDFFEMISLKVSCLELITKSE